MCVLISVCFYYLLTSVCWILLQVVGFEDEDDYEDEEGEEEDEEEEEEEEDEDGDESDERPKKAKKKVTPKKVPVKAVKSSSAATVTAGTTTAIVGTTPAISTTTATNSLRMPRLGFDEDDIPDLPSFKGLDMEGLTGGFESPPLEEFKRLMESLGPETMFAEDYEQFLAEEQMHVAPIV